jgi:alpha-D-ribose 1-methylphosphonate 5-triphosphate diphosphatase
MAQTVIDGVTLVPGGGKPIVRDAAVVLDDVGTIVEISDGAPGDDLFLAPAVVDLHLDNLVQRRRPRATVSLDHEAVITVLDAECAAAGIATVCVAARCEDSPRKGIDIADAAVLAAVVEKLAPYLCCDWRIHARVELTDDGAIESLLAVLSGILAGGADFDDRDVGAAQPILVARRDAQVLRTGLGCVRGRGRGRVQCRRRPTGSGR